MTSFLTAARRRLTWIGATGVLASILAVPSALALTSGTLVTTGSPTTPFPQNKQNEPEVAVNPLNTSIVVAGANDEIDLEACNVGNDKSCPFTPGVGVSGVYFSFDGGSTWTQPTYTGYSKRHCLGVAGDQSDTCDARTPETSPPGLIGTLPKYWEQGLVADGDPALAFGPKTGPGGFSWSNGVRLYYANLTANFSTERSETTFKGFEAIGVSRTDDVAAAAAGDKNAWMDPVIASRQNSALFSDHEAMTVDNVATSPFFGNVYVCDAAFRSQEISPNALPVQIVLNRSTDGGATWTQTAALSPTFNNNTLGGRQDCQVDTDSKGTVYVFWDGTDPRTKQFGIFMARSSDGGKTFPGSARFVTAVNPTGIAGDWDGVAGARDGSAPLVDIANGAPSGVGATDEIVLVYPDGPTPTPANGLPNEEAFVRFSTTRGNTWSAPVNAATASDRPLFPAIAISPTGTDVYVTYDAFLQPYQPTTGTTRLFRGVVRHADVNPATGAIGSWSDLVRDPTGDARASSANALTDEFLGDYNAMEAFGNVAVGVWNDGRNAAVCSGINAYRQDVLNGTAAGDVTDSTRPAPNVDCPGTFGNTDIFGGSFADPTP